MKNKTEKIFSIIISIIYFLVIFLVSDKYYIEKVILSLIMVLYAFFKDKLFEWLEKNKRAHLYIILKN
ncbi:hypothetical protein [Enterococcus faecalis]|uniref:hypothetical protein n=1 Tax=Enterococcus faecalis TaxID=1351 RepID=UPI00032DC604|nr:hypothetical protein [Enterococcus faecalis]EOE09504.1 hypothetical protein Q9U_02999 [Enterococcus faecalis EnGen0079]EOL33833.1 hypothetical protein WMG_03026 [Enterococcus faecalis EnGen0348]